MKKMKRTLSIILSLLLLSMTLTACGSKDNDKDPTPTPTPTQAATESNEGTTAPVTTDLEPVTLTWYLHGSTVTDDKDVMEKVNEYLKEKLNVTLKPIWGTWGDFNDNVLLAINGGDNVDIYFTCSWSANEYNQFAKKGAYVRLDDPDNNLIEKYGKDVWNTLPQVLRDGAVIRGSDGTGVYAVPGYKDIATQNCWDVNVTLLEKYGFTTQDIQDAGFYGFGDILKVVKEGEEATNGGTFYPLLVEASVLERMVNNSVIVTGDSGVSNLLSYYLNPDDVSALGTYGNTILNKFATPEYKAFVEKTREYYLAGYIDPAMGNADQANSIRTEKQGMGEYLIGTQSYSLGYEVQVSATRGIEVAMVPLTDPYVDTTSSQGALMAISTSSKNPERAMMFLNLLNTDPYLMTLLEYGIEGVHYELVNGGEVKFLEKRDVYSPWTNGMGNVTQLPPIEGQGLDFQDQFKAYYAAAKETPILGWAFDPTSVENEMGALANVAAQYALALNAGVVDPATELPAFLKKLEDNGIQKVVDEANRQFSEYLASK